MHPAKRVRRFLLLVLNLAILLGCAHHKMESDRVLDGDDGDYTCPLCVEEFDIQDRNFKPCPCGYQVCPFCWNHIRNNLNGLCPACRRPYSDEPEWKPVAVEEYAQLRLGYAYP